MREMASACGCVSRGGRVADGFVVTTQHAHHLLLRHVAHVLAFPSVLERVYDGDRSDLIAVENEKREHKKVVGSLHARLIVFLCVELLCATVHVGAKYPLLPRLEIGV